MVGWLVPSVGSSLLLSPHSSNQITTITVSTINTETDIIYYRHHHHHNHHHCYYYYYRKLQHMRSRMKRRQRHASLAKSFFWFSRWLPSASWISILMNKRVKKANMRQLAKFHCDQSIVIHCWDRAIYWFVSKWRHRHLGFVTIGVLRPPTKGTWWFLSLSKIQSEVMLKFQLYAKF